MIITELLERNAASFPNDVALVELNPQEDIKKPVTWKDFELVPSIRNHKRRKEISWKIFNQKANRFANLLTNLGVKKGDRVAILLMNCLEWLPIYFGILKTGALAVPLNYRYTSEEIEYCFNFSDASVLVFGTEFISRVEPLVGMGKLPKLRNLLYVGEDCPTFADSYFFLTADCSTKYITADLTPDDDAAIYYSSGTTGLPKAILHTHKSLMCACLTEYHNHGQTKEDSFLCIPPLYHTGAKMHWFGSLYVGGKGVILRGVKPKWILEAVSEEQITIVWLLVPWAQDILDAIDSGEINLDDYKLDQWRLMHIGAQPVPPSLIRRWLEKFPNHLYDTNYGLSESTGPGCVNLGLGNIHKVGAIGRAGWGWQTKIVDENFNEVPRGGVGELAVKGDGVMKCYYKDEAATKAVLREGGWLLTGDMAMEDEDGFIYLVDRKKDVIITGGENIYPVQIEDYLRSHGDIKDVAVIGAPHKRLGEIVLAIVELKEGRNTTEEELMEFCAKALPRYKQPKRIIFDKVPRNPTGKIEKPALRKKYCGEKTLIELQLEE
ncbi:MAG TPA: class I adenylate-forming enzyme family protein [Clostridia bacterium]|nr:class I adenylate-forming enzyme family protein [Clostridia bacterium]HOL60605.1 class I adenylate-forming enzyme family protein [Clostridia bacterium]HPO53012.1 class I adenylate-forming enzyme family protein [Clostridia bacterium]